MDSNESLIKILIKKMGNLDIKNTHGQTPLSIAFDKGNIKIINLLIYEYIFIFIRKNNL